MDSIDYENDFVFLTDKKGQLTGGGFTIRSELLENTIYGDKSTNNNYQVGAGAGAGNGAGNGAEYKTILDSLKDMVVPAGLFYVQHNTKKNQTVKYGNNSEPVEDTLYNKLLDLVSPEKRMINSIKTRKKRDNKQKMTRKNK